MSAHRTLADLLVAAYGQPDPGSGGTISVDRGLGYVSLVTAAAEARTLARPTKEGLIFTVMFDTYVGAVTLTVTGGYNNLAATSITMGDAGDYITFISVKIGTAYYWRLLAYEGTTLTGAEQALTGVTAGTLAASKALVVSAASAIDQLTITKLRKAVTLVTAVGSVQSLATNSLSPGLNVITGGGTDLGLKLPTPEVGLEVIVKNAIASAAIVYGDVTATIINALATTTGLSVGATKDVTFLCENTTRWWSLPLAIA